MRTESFEFAGKTYQVTQVSSKVGVRIAARLANVMAPALSTLPTDGFENVNLAEVVSKLFGNTELGDTLEYLNAIFAERTVVSWVDDSGTPRTFPLARIFDEHFADAYDALVAWLGFALQLSMSSFFRSARGFAELLAQVQTRASNSKSPSSAAQSGHVGE